MALIFKTPEKVTYVFRLRSIVQTEILNFFKNIFAIRFELLLIYPRSKFYAHIE